MTQTNQRRASRRTKGKGSSAARRGGAAAGPACCPGLAEGVPLRLFRALCDATRVRILGRLAGAEGPLSVTRAAEGMAVDLSVVSRHLAMLREAGAVTAQRRGKEVCYAVRGAFLAELLRELADRFEACCPGEPASPRAASRRAGKERRG